MFVGMAAVAMAAVAVMVVVLTVVVVFVFVAGESSMMSVREKATHAKKGNRYRPKKKNFFFFSVLKISSNARATITSPSLVSNSYHAAVNTSACQH